MVRLLMGAMAGALPAAPSRVPWPELREELQILPAGTHRDGSPAWHLADPVRNLFFRVGWLEFEILRRWDMHDPAAIAADIAATTTLQPDSDDVSDFAVFLQRQELTRTTVVRPKHGIGQWLLHNYLFIRVPLVRPERWLRAFTPRVAWLFSRRFLALTFAAGLIGLVLAARQWDTVVANVRGAMSWEGIFAFGAAIFFSKIWHELGHAFVATRHGVRVAHMGVAFLVMWPMAYTDTGETWKLENPRERLAIASAGLLSEGVLAAWCTFLWSFAPEGNFRNALFFLGTTAWVLTLALNASPFMRFDGYFILSDLLDYPGLHERAGRWAKRWMRWHLLGMRDPAPDVVSDGFRRFLTSFAFVTWAYRLTVFLGIAIVVYHKFFKALGLFLFLVEIVMFVFRPVLMEWRVWRARRDEIQWSRARRWLALLAVIALAVCVPWSGRVSAPGVMQAGFEQPLYTPFPARLERFTVAEGARVASGQVLFTLVAAEPGTDQAKALALRDAYESRARGAGALDDHAAAKQVVADHMARQYAAEESSSVAEQHRLLLRASADGRLMDLDPSLVEGSWVSPHTRMATVVATTRWRVQALVSEADRQRLEPGMEARVYKDGEWKPLVGRVIAVDNGAVQKLPSSVLAKEHGGSIPLNPTAPAKDLRPANAWYRVLVEGGGLTETVSSKGPVTVRFDAGRESLAKRWIDSAMLVLLQQTGLGKDG